MKKIQREVVTKSYVDVFIANDGTEFKNQDECEKYDDSAKGVLLAKYAPMVVSKTNEYALFGVGCEDNPVEIVRLKTQEDADIVLQLLILESPYLNDEDYKVRREKVLHHLNSAIGDFLLIGRGYDEDCFFTYGSRKSYIEDFNKNFENI